MSTADTWLSALVILIKEVKEIFDKKTQKKQKAYEAIEAIYKAANRTSFYITMNQNGTYKSNLELSDLWMETAVKVRDLDLALYEQLLMKAEYWSNPQNWSNEDVKTTKIGLLEIKRAAREILQKK
ncbi:MAG: hypothetical protein AB9834_19345 [Lentimicrobium sp.]